MAAKDDIILQYFSPQSLPGREPGLYGSINSNIFTESLQDNFIYISCADPQSNMI